MVEFRHRQPHRNENAKENSRGVSFRIADLLKSCYLCGYMSYKSQQVYGKHNLIYNFHMK